MNLRLGILLSISLLVAVVVFFKASSSMDHGGNAAALGVVRQYASVAYTSAVEAPDHLFRVTSLSPELKKQIAPLAENQWVKGADFLVSTVPLDSHATVGAAPRPIIVCATAFDNFPSHFLLRNRPTYAVGYSDGTSALIPPKDFKMINQSQFVPLDRLLSSQK